MLGIVYCTVIMQAIRAREGVTSSCFALSRASFMMPYCCQARIVLTISLAVELSTFSIFFRPMVPEDMEEEGFVGFLEAKVQEV